LVDLHNKVVELDLVAYNFVGCLLEPLAVDRAALAGMSFGQWFVFVFEVYHLFY